MKKQKILRLFMLGLVPLFLAICLLGCGVERRTPESAGTSPKIDPSQTDATTESEDDDPELEMTAITEDTKEPIVSYRYSRSLGITGEPYRADFGHLNRPTAIFIDDEDEIYIVEGVGSRLIKFDTSGNVLFSIGRAGVQFAADDDFSVPHDVVLDSEGNIWVVDNHRAIHFDPNGLVLQVMGEGWYSEEEYFFDTPRGIAMDSQGRLFVSDQGHHRIQVFAVSDSIATYSETIGESGVEGEDDSHFKSPAQIAFDSQDRLYVVDRLNFRVQRCVESDGWICTTFHGTGVRGDGPEELNGPIGIGIDNFDTIFIGDTNGRRVKRCELDGICTIFADDLPRPTDIATDSAGTIYIVVQNSFIISKYDSSGAYIGDFAGTKDEPYAPGNRHIHSPWGMATADDGSIYVTEYRGHRVLKLNPDGSQAWSIGEAGRYGADNYHFGSWWGGLQGNMAIDSQGRLFVTDTTWSRMQIYSAEGVYEETFGEFGDGEYQLDCPSGIAISPLNGDVVINDRCNQRVQIYSSEFEYVATIGETDVIGDGSNHFHWPSEVAVDTSGVIYVTDSGNRRVQKCTVDGASGSCTTFVAEKDVEIEGGNPFNPQSIAIDSAGRVIVSDNGNSRVLVFDSNGNHLVTIGGVWGSGSGEFVNPMGVAVDAFDNVYVSDMDNYRIQVFTVVD